MTDRLRQKEIKPMDFLRQLAYKNKDFTDTFDNFTLDVGFCSDAENSDYDDTQSDDGISTISSQSSSSKSSNCKKCDIELYSIVLFPCGHVCCCKCWEKHENYFALSQKPGPKMKKKTIDCIFDCGAKVANTCPIKFE